jgi:hypothetical protein
MKKCKTCGTNAYSDYCFLHKPNILSKGTNKSKYNTSELHEFYKLIWKKRGHCSEISGENLRFLSSFYFHHILEKSKFPQATFDEDNIIILTSLEHGNIHHDTYKYPEVNKRRELLKNKYGIG